MFWWDQSNVTISTTVIITEAAALLHTQNRNHGAHREAPITRLVNRPVAVEVEQDGRGAIGR